MVIDPVKVNKILKDELFLCHKGKINHVGIETKLKSGEIKLIIDRIDLTLFLNSQRKFQGESSESDFRDVEHFNDKEKPEENKDKTKQGENTGTEAEASFIDKLMNKFQIELVIKNMKIELKMEKPSRIGASLNIFIDNMKFTKMKTAAANILYSFKAYLSKLEIKLFKPESQKDELLFCATRIVSNHGDTEKGALTASLDVIKIGVRKKLSIRMDLGSIQAVSTPTNLLLLIHLLDKIDQFSMQSAVFSEQIEQKMKVPENSEYSDTSGELDETLYETANGGGQLLRSLNFTDLAQSLYMSSVKFSKEGSQFDLKKDVMNNLKELNEKNVSLTSSGSKLGSSHTCSNRGNIESLIPSIDLDLKAQGIYLGLFKEEISTEFFEWVVENDGEKDINFSSSLCSHFLFKAEKIDFCYISNSSANEASHFKLSTLKLENYRFNEVDKQLAESRLDSHQTKYDSCVQAGLSMYSSVKQDSFRFGGTRQNSGENTSSMFDTVDNDHVSSMYSQGTIFEITNQKSTQFEPSPAIDIKFTIQKKEIKIKALIKDLNIKLNLDKLKFILDDSHFLSKLNDITKFLLSESRTCKEDQFRKTEKEQYYCGQTEYNMKRLVKLLKENEENPQILKMIKRHIYLSSVEYSLEKKGEIMELEKKMKESIPKFEKSPQMGKKIENLNEMLIRCNNTEIKKLERKPRIDFSLTILNIDVLVCSSDKRKFLDPIYLRLSTKNVTAKLTKNFSLSFVDKVELKIGKKINPNIKENETVDKKEANFSSLLEIKVNDGGNIIGYENGNLMFSIFSVELMLNPENLENLTILSTSVSSKLIELADQFEKLSKEASNVLGLMDVAYDLFDEEKQIRTLVSKIYLSCLDPVLEFKEISGYVGLIGISLNDEFMSQTMMNTHKAPQISLKKEDPEGDDWFMVDNEGIYNIAEEQTKEEDRKNHLVGNLQTILRFELKNMMVNLLEDIQDPGTYQSKLLIHSLRLFDGMTYSSLLQNESNYKTEFLELYSVDYKSNPLYYAKLKSDYEIQHCLKVFKSIWNNLESEGAFLALRVNPNIYDNETKSTITKVTVNMKSIIATVVLSRNTEPFACLMKVIDDTCQRIDRISVILSQYSERQEPTQQPDDTFDLYQDNSFKKDDPFSLKDELKKMEDAEQKKNQEKPDDQSLIKLDIAFGGIFFDIKSLNSYRCITEFDKIKASVTLFPNQDMKLNMVFTNISTFITNSLDAIKRKDCHTNIWKEKFQQILYFPSLEIDINTKKDNNGDEKIEMNIDVKKCHSYQKEAGIYINVSFLDVIYNFLAQLLKFMETGTKKTRFLFRNTSKKTKEIRKVVPQQFVKPDDDLNASGWYQVAPRDGELKQVLSYLSRRGRISSQEIWKSDDLLFESLQEPTHKEKSSLLKVCCSVSCFEVKIFQSEDGKNTKTKKTEKKNFLLKMSNLNFSFRADETSEVEESKKLQKVKYTILMNIENIIIVDNVKSSIYANLLKIEPKSLSFYFRITENVSQKENNVKAVNHRRTRGRSMSISESDLLNPPVIARKRMMSDDNDYKTELERYFDKVACVCSVKPIHIYLHNESVEVIKEMIEKVNTTMNSIKFAQSMLSSQNMSQSEMIVPKSKKEEGPFFCMDYLYFTESHVNVYTLSSTNLSAVNYLPNLDLKLSEKYCEFLEGVSVAEIANSLISELSSDFSLVKVMKINLKNLPVFTTVYQAGKILEGMFRAAGNKNGAGFFRSFNKLLILGISSFLKTGKFGMKIISDALKIIGLNMINQNKMERIFEKIISMIEGTRKDNPTLKA